MSHPEKKRILIVDDEEDLTGMLSLHVKSLGGYEVATAGNGREGLEKAGSFLPDLVLLDIMMPEMDGWEFCRRLKADPALWDTAVIVMTAQQVPGLEEKGRAAGASGLIRKPFTLAQITTLLASLESEPLAGEPVTSSWRPRP